MRVTSKTKYRKFLPYEGLLTTESETALKQQAERVYKPCHTLTINEFFGVINGDYSVLGDMSDPSVLQVYWLKRFAEYVEIFADACKRTKIEPTPEQKQAAQGCLEMSPAEGMLVFARSYFGLHSLREAGDITINEYIMARKDTYNNALVRRNLEKIQLRKLNSKK